MLFAHGIVDLLEAGHRLPRPLVEHDMIDEGGVARIAARLCTGIREPQIGIGGIAIVDFAPDRIVRFAQPAIPVAENRETHGTTRSGVDPAFKSRYLLQKG